MVQKIFIPASVLIIILISGYIGFNEYHSKEKTISFADSTRKYRVHLPKNYNESKTYPLIVALHGLTSTPRLFELTTGLSREADKRGFIVVYPYGNKNREISHYSWNAGFCCDPADNQDTNDPDFILKVTQQVQMDYAVDKGKTFVVGFSDGGMLANLIVLRHHEVFSKAAVVASAVGGSREEDETFKFLKKSDVARSIVIFHGKEDQVIPFDGGAGRGSEFEFTGAYDVVNFWLENNKCSKHPSKISKKDNITVEHYSDCPDNTEVLFYGHNGKHIWPGGFSDFMRNITGSSVSATTLIWNFFNN